MPRHKVKIKHYRKEVIYRCAALLGTFPNPTCRWPPRHQYLGAVLLLGSCPHKPQVIGHHKYL